MSRLSFAVLLMALAACRNQTPHAPPTSAALGSELATFPQVFVPLTSQTLDELNEAIARKGRENVMLTSFRQSYVHGSATINGKKIPTFVSYSSPWLAPKGAPLQPMSILQFLHAFAIDEQTDLAMMNSPKGNMFFTRAQLPDVIGSARAAGATSGDLPFTLVRGSGR